MGAREGWGGAARGAEHDGGETTTTTTTTRANFPPAGFLTRSAGKRTATSLLVLLNFTFDVAFFSFPFFAFVYTRVYTRSVTGSYVYELQHD